MLLCLICLHVLNYPNVLDYNIYMVVLGHSDFKCNGSRLMNKLYPREN